MKVVDADRESVDEAAELERRTLEFAPLEHAELAQVAVRLSLERDLAFAFAGDLSRQIVRVKGSRRVGDTLTRDRYGAVTSLENAIALALEARRGQRDASGESSVLQLLRRMFRCGTELEKIVALLMDVVQTRNVTLGDLREMGFDEEIVAALAAATQEASPADYTPRQGQFLAFIYSYTQVTGQEPTERDVERYFKISGSGVRDMIERLEWGKFITCSDEKPHRLRVLVPAEQLPELEELATPAGLVRQRDRADRRVSLACG